MLRALLRDLARIRPVLLTDLADLSTDVKVRLLEKLGTHQGVHRMCPGWCPCEVDLDLDDETDELGDDELGDDELAADYRWTTAA